MLAVDAVAHVAIVTALLEAGCLPGCGGIHVDQVAVFDVGGLIGVPEPVVTDVSVAVNLVVESGEQGLSVLAFGCGVVP